jgi:hypothetical protein
MARGDDMSETAEAIRKLYRREGATRVYGQSDDNIYFKGEFWGQAGGGEPDEHGRGTLVVMSDGTLLEIAYGGRVPGIWEVKVRRKGNLYLRVDICTDEDADPYSDVAHFGPGIKWAYKADDWRPVD